VKIAEKRSFDQTTQSTAMVTRSICCARNQGPAGPRGTAIKTFDPCDVAASPADGPSPGTSARVLKPRTEPAPPGGSTAPAAPAELSAPKPPALSGPQATRPREGPRSPARIRQGGQKSQQRRRSRSRKPRLPREQCRRPQDRGSPPGRRRGAQAPSQEAPAEKKPRSPTGSLKEAPVEARLRQKERGPRLYYHRRPKNPAEARASKAEASDMSFCVISDVPVIWTPARRPSQHPGGPHYLSFDQKTDLREGQDIAVRILHVWWRTPLCFPTTSNPPPRTIGFVSPHPGRRGCAVHLHHHLNSAAPIIRMTARRCAEEYPGCASACWTPR
jgi:hypothetical protein